MHISPVSNVDPVNKVNAPPAQAPKSPTPAESTDTVHLSAAAQAHLAGGDADGDGDAH